MFFEKLFKDYDDNIEKFFIDHNVRNVEKLYEIRNNTYRNDSIHRGERSYIIKQNLKNLLKEVFYFSDDLVKKLNKEFKLLDTLFNPNQESPVDFVDKNSLFVKKTIKNDDDFYTRKRDEILISFLQSGTVLSITIDGVSFSDGNGLVTSGIIPFSVNIDSSIIEAIDKFNINLSRLACVEAKKIDKVFFKKINQLSCVDMFNARKTVDSFSFVSQEQLEVILAPERAKDRFSSLWVGEDNCLMIGVDYSSLFLKAFNFYYNYKSMMNEKHISTIKLDFRHKLDEFDTAVIIINIGFEFEINISVPFSSNGLSRDSTFHVSGTVIKEDTPVSLHADDLSGLYDYIFESCNQKIIKLVDKSLNEFETRDIELLKMIKI